MCMPSDTTLKTYNTAFIMGLMNCQPEIFEKFVITENVMEANDKLYLTTVKSNDTPLIKYSISQDNCLVYYQGSDSPCDIIHVYKRRVYKHTKIAYF